MFEPTNKDLSVAAAKASHKWDNHHAEILNRLDAFDERFNEIDKKLMKLDGVAEIFSNVQGFNGVAVWLLKVLAGIGVALGGLYAIIEVFRKLSK